MTFHLTKGCTWRSDWYRSDTDAFNCKYCELIKHQWTYEPKTGAYYYIPDLERQNPPGPFPFGDMKFLQENKSVKNTADFAPHESKVSRGTNGIGDHVIFAGLGLLKITDPGRCAKAMGHDERVAAVSSVPIMGGCAAWVYIREWPPPAPTMEPSWLLWNHCWPIPEGYQKVPAFPQKSLWKNAWRGVLREPQAEMLPFNDEAEILPFNIELQTFKFAREISEETDTTG